MMAVISRWTVDGPSPIETGTAARLWQMLVGDEMFANFLPSEGLIRSGSLRSCFTTRIVGMQDLQNHSAAVLT